MRIFALFIFFILTVLKIFSASHFAEEGLDDDAETVVEPFRWPSHGGDCSELNVTTRLIRNIRREYREHELTRRSKKRVILASQFFEGHNEYFTNREIFFLQAIYHSDTLYGGLAKCLTLYPASLECNALMGLFKRMDEVDLNLENSSSIETDDVPVLYFGLPPSLHGDLALNLITSVNNRANEISIIDYSQLPQDYASLFTIQRIVDYKFLYSPFVYPTKDLFVITPLRHYLPGIDYEIRVYGRLFRIKTLYNSKYDVVFVNFGNQNNPNWILLTKNTQFPMFMESPLSFLIFSGWTHFHYEEINVI